MHTFTTAEADPEVLARVRELLDDAFDDYADTDWQNALGGRHVVVTEHDTVVAHASVVPRRIDVGERTVRTGTSNRSRPRPGREGLGLGSLAMTEIAAIVRREYEMGALSTARNDFYARLGWERWQGPTFVRDGRRPSPHRGRRRRPHGPPLRCHRAPRPLRTDHLRPPPRRRLVTQQPFERLWPLRGAAATMH